LLRPSSAPVAKASTVCSSKLDHIHEFESRPPQSPAADMTNGPTSTCVRVGSSLFLINRSTIAPDRHRPGSSLRRRIKDARVHCVVLNIRSVLPHRPTQTRDEAEVQDTRPPRPLPARTIRSLRTQQRARHLPTTASRSQPPEGSRTEHTPEFGNNIINVPPMS
jgi:hypothetical protein